MAATPVTLKVTFAVWDLSAIRWKL